MEGIVGVRASLVPWTRVVSYRIFARLFSSGAAKPVVYPETFSLDKVADGLVAIEQRKTWGRVIAHVREPSQAKGKL